METHKIFIDAKLEFDVPAEHEVLAVTKALVWLCDTLAKDKDSPLQAVGFNLGKKQE